jgi:hypothetical protein
MTVVKFYFLSYRILNYVHIYQLYKSRDRLSNFVQSVFREKCYRLRHLLGLSKFLDILQYVILNALTHLCRKQPYCTWYIHPHIQWICVHFFYSMERDITILCAPVTYYASCAYEAVTDFVEVVIDQTCCGTYWWWVHISIIHLYN